MNEATIPDLHAEMQAVVANLEAREWIQRAEVDGDKVCAHGAVMTCEALRPGDEQIIRAVMRHRGLTEAWNDADGRVKGEVLARMRLIEVSDADLGETFGSNWRLVIAVIRRAAILTEDEAKRLTAARTAARDAAPSHAAWHAAMNAAIAAAVDAAVDAERYAAMDAAMDASMDASWYAARGAATAAVVADLVGQYRLTQNHIDTLMQPWTDTLGQDWAEGIKS